MLDISEIHNSTINFAEAVLLVTKKIPQGKVLGYGHLAALIGKPRNARQVGQVLKHAPLKDLPWWRVLRSDGSIAMQGDPNRGPLQLQYLKNEKVCFRGAKVNMKESRWRPEIT
jgi:methylated-DNA-protein-cysteine methyltransferase related protein